MDHNSFNFQSELIDPLSEFLKANLFDLPLAPSPSTSPYHSRATFSYLSTPSQHTARCTSTLTLPRQPTFEDSLTEDSGPGLSPDFPQTATHKAFIKHSKVLLNKVRRRPQLATYTTPQKPTIAYLR